MINDDSRWSPSVARPAALPAVLRAATIAALLLLAACSKGASTKTAFSTTGRPDTYPIMLNKDMPFRYPPALYAEKVQGNVTLRLYVDKDGSVVEDSTRVLESSNIPTLDSAAVTGSRELKFEPAKLRGVPMAVSILFPVYFRHPDAPPPPGDSILKKSITAGRDSSTTRTTGPSAAKKRSSSSAKHPRK
jgi:TonB family protein